MCTGELPILYVAKIPRVWPSQWINFSPINRVLDRALMAVDTWGLRKALRRWGKIQKGRHDRVNMMQESTVDKKKWIKKLELNAYDSCLSQFAVNWHVNSWVTAKHVFCAVTVASDNEYLDHFMFKALIPNLKKFPQGIPEIFCFIQNIMPSATAVDRVEAYK